jgi:LacI family transcriptional regulator
VKPKTLAAVTAAVESLAYVPDGSARSLALGRSFTVGAVIPIIDHPVYGDFIHALQHELGEANYALLISAHEYDREAEVAIIARLIQRGVDGVILVGTDHDPRVVAQLDRADVPYLYTWSTDEAAGRPCVGVSNRRAMQQVAAYLTKLGHKNIAVLSGHTEHNERARARLDGILDALILADCNLPADHIVYGPFTVEAGREGLRKVMALDPMPTALICATDLIAAGALAQAAEMGIKVPQDISITGFDNTVYSSLLSPKLTTIDLPAAALGVETGKAILRAVNRLPFEPSDIETKLIVRDSTAVPRDFQA